MWVAGEVTRKLSFQRSRLRLLLNRSKAEISAERKPVTSMAWPTVLDWMKRYSSSSATKRVQLSPQRQVVSAVVEGRMTIAEAQAAYNIASGSTVRRWVRVYKQQNR